MPLCNGTVEIQFLSVGDRHPQDDAPLFLDALSLNRDAHGVGSP